MNAIQADRIRELADRDPAVRDILEFHSDHKNDTSISARSLARAMKDIKKPIGGPKAKEYIEFLLKMRLGKRGEDSQGFVKIYDMSVGVKDIADAVLRQDANPERFEKEVEKRGVVKAAASVVRSPEEFKVYPARQTGHLSVSININGRMVSLIIPDDTPPELIPVIYERLKKTDDSVYGK